MNYEAKIVSTIIGLCAGLIMLFVVMLINARQLKHGKKQQVDERYAAWRKIAEDQQKELETLKLEMRLRRFEDEMSL